MNMIVDLFFTIAAFLWTICGIPQILKVYKTKKSDDLSLLFLCTSFMAYIFFITAYLLNNQIYMFYIYLVPTMIILTLIYLTIKYKK